MSDDGPDIETLDISRKDFAAWLASRPPLAPVGVCRDSNRCPLAAYLRDCGHNPEVSDDAISMYHESGDMSYFSMPSWARAFVAAVDVGDAESEVLRERAMQCLEAIGQHC